MNCILQQATTPTRKRPLDPDPVVKKESPAAAAAEEAAKKPKTESDQKEVSGGGGEDNSSVVSKVVVDLVNTVGDSSESNGVKGEQQQGPVEAAREFRECSLRRILQQNLNKAVNDDANVDNVVKSVDELKKKMKVVMLSALVRSKSETEEAGHDLFPSRVASEDGEAADNEEESEPEPNASSESSKSSPEEGVVRKVLEEFLDGSKQSKELLGSSDNARGSLLGDLLGSLKNELQKERRQAEKRRKKKSKMAAAASAASTSIVLTEEETKVLLFPDDNSGAETSVVVQLSDVPPDMVPISTAIEDVEAGAEATIVVNNSPAHSPTKVAKVIDKSKLFSQMEDTFAKDTNPALKNRPIYRRRTNNSASAASDSIEGCSSLIWSPPKSPSKATAAAGAAVGKDEKFLVINEPGEVKGEEVVGSEEEKVDEEEEEEEGDEELPKLIKSDEKCDEDREEDSGGPPQLTRQVPAKEGSEEEIKGDKAAEAAPVLEAMDGGEGPPQLPPPVPSACTNSPKKSSTTSSSDLTKSLRKVRN